MAVLARCEHQQIDVVRRAVWDGLTVATGRFGFRAGRIVKELVAVPAPLTATICRTWTSPAAGAADSSSASCSA
jgi:hypothetical protein